MPLFFIAVIATHPNRLPRARVEGVFVFAGYANPTLSAHEKRGLFVIPDASLVTTDYSLFTRSRFTAQTPR